MHATFQQAWVYAKPGNFAEAARRLVAEAGKPARVILFGSYARDDSDIDILVEFQAEKKDEELFETLSAMECWRVN